MITGIHIIAFAQDAEQTRAFFRDVLELRSVDAGGGWLIFALPPAQFAAHPIDADDPAPQGQARCGLYLMCDDLPN
jgi:catechol 2,3-dioxygenase-like lactoylglutathione lyase family enzyme